MKADIHPKYEETTISCACGATLTIRSTGRNMKVTTCSSCHPFFTGKKGSRVLTEAGRLEKFQKKYEGINYGQKESAE